MPLTGIPAISQEPSGIKKKSIYIFLLWAVSFHLKNRDLDVGYETKFCFGKRQNDSPDVRKQEIFQIAIFLFENESVCGPVELPAGEAPRPGRTVDAWRSFNH